jgi:hypothetical protein
VDVSELIKLIREAAADVKPGENKCKFCGQGFVKESTLAVHQCEPKRRAQQKGEKGVQIAFAAWIRFYELSQGSAKTKSSDDFCNSQFYNAFVKFGRHCVSISAVNTQQFTEYVLKNQIKIDRWCSDKVYDAYLFQLLRTEQATDAVERSIMTMTEWANESVPPEQPPEFSEYFRVVSNNRFVLHVQNGRISPWAIYCSESGIEKLETLTDEQVGLIIRWIDPEFWQKRMKDFSADTTLIKHIMEQAGL